MGGYSMARDLAPFVECGISPPISGNRDREINMDDLLDYRMGESADIEEIEFLTDSEEES